MAKQILIKLNIFIFVALASVNLATVFMPELGFDALWYHLPLSKLFLSRGQWYFPGGLYYYSAMPRLAELISLPFFAALGYIGPKLIQFLAGLAVCFFIYRLTRKFISDKLLSLVAVNLFYATWLVSWESASGYVDLVRTAFEVVALYLLVTRSGLWSKLISGIFLGLAIGTKWQALGSLFLYLFVFSPVLILPALLTASPWFYLAFHFTGNPVYPLLEPFMHTAQLSSVSADFYNPLSIFSRFFLAPLFLTKPSGDFLSPVVGLVYLIGLLGLFSSRPVIRRISLLGVLGTFYLLLTPPPSTRYFLPFLPAVILACVYVISRLKQSLALWLVVLFTLSAHFVLGMRLFAFAKYAPYLSGRLTRNQFLASLSYRLPDTFIDADDFVSKNLPPKAKYLISNQLHNLYYFPYDFDHDSFADQSRRYDYLVTKDAVPAAINGDLIHTNEIGIQIFKL